MCECLLLVLLCMHANVTNIVSVCACVRERACVACLERHARTRTPHAHARTHWLCAFVRVCERAY